MTTYLHGLTFSQMAVIYWRLRDQYDSTERNVRHAAYRRRLVRMRNRLAIAICEATLNGATFS
jgi:hypothetical protein